MFPHFSPQLMSLQHVFFVCMLTCQCYKVVNLTQLLFVTGNFVKLTVLSMSFLWCVSPWSRLYRSLIALHWLLGCSLLGSDILKVRYFALDKSALFQSWKNIGSIQDCHAQKRSPDSVLLIWFDFLNYLHRSNFCNICQHELSHTGYHFMCF